MAEIEGIFGRYFQSPNVRGGKSFGRCFSILKEQDRIKTAFIT